MSTAVVWLRRDLRLADNPALQAALRAHDRVVCTYIHAPQEEAPWVPGAASRWWLHHSLVALDTALGKRGTRLHVRGGSSRVELESIVHASGAAAVYWNRLYEPAIVARDADIKLRLRAMGIDAQSFNAGLLVEPWQIQTAGGGPYRVFTPFWRKAQTLLATQPPVAAPKRIAGIELPHAAEIDTLQLLPASAWDAGLRKQWTPGERGAHALLRRFCGEALSEYQHGRDRPDLDHTSRLSAHLHFGEIGPRQILWALAELRQSGLGAQSATHAETFMRELGWREFSHHLLYHFPQVTQRSLQPQFDAFPWAPDNSDAIDRWQRGRTGFPIIDAGMRQLWKSGWMHNRVRMLVASYLTKNLRQHWLHGARWFWDTLVDADLANNTQGWQWSAGCGADAAPYFRIFNPVTQALRFDPEGAYVRHWVPELRRVPAPLVHRPWQDPLLLERSGYPAPMLDLAASRETALEAYRTHRAAADWNRCRDKEA